MHSPLMRLGRCEACQERVWVFFSDGVPVRSEEVHTMTPLNGDPMLILHLCDQGDEVSPLIAVEGYP